MSKIKEELRAGYKKRRNEYMLIESHRYACENTFINSKFYLNSDVLLLYASINSEPDTFYLIDKALNDRKTVYLPKVNGETMSFHKINSLKDLSKGCFGIKEPINGLVFNSQTAACIVPGLAFDKKGCRLGYGKGYYDKYLVDKPDIVKIGFCAGCGLADEVPAESNDVFMDCIIVDDEIFCI